MGTGTPEPELIEKLLSDVYPSSAFLSGVQLGIFTVLKEEPLRVEEIAIDLKLEPRKLEPLL